MDKYRGQFIRQMVKYIINSVLISFFLFFYLPDAGAFTDPLGRVVKIPDNPSRIVAIGPSALRLLVYMDLDHFLVGIEEYEKKTAGDKPYSIAMMPEKVNGLPTIASGAKPGLLPDVEKILSLNPDIIVCSVYSGRKNIEMIAQKTGIATIGLLYNGGKEIEGISYIEGAKKSFLALGEIFSRRQRAKELISGIEAILQELKGFRVKKNTGSIYIGGLRSRGEQGIVSTDYDFYPFTLLGLKNIFSGHKQFGTVTVQKEAILSQNPDYIFLDIGGHRKILADMQQDKKFYGHLNAFQTNRVYWLPHTNFYSISLCNALINAYIIAEKIGLSNVNASQKSQVVYQLFFSKRAPRIIKYYLCPVMVQNND